MKKQEELWACYDNYLDIDDIVNRETRDIKSAEEQTRFILSKSPSGNAAETDTLCHVINNLIGNGNQECLFFDSRQGVDLHDASANLADLTLVLQIDHLFWNKIIAMTLSIKTIQKMNRMIQKLLKHWIV